MFSVRRFLDFIFSWTGVSISFILFSIPGFLYSISYTLLVRIASEVPVWIIKLLISIFLPFSHISLSMGYLCWFYFYFQLLSYFIQFCPLFVYTFIDPVKGFTLFLLKDLYLSYSYSCFKIFVLCFSYVESLGTYCGRVAGLFRSHIVLTVIVSTYLILERL